MDANEIRPVAMWAVHYGNGHIDRHSVRPTRAQAIDAFCSDPAGPRWDYWRRTGCRAVKVCVSSRPTPEAKERT